MRGCRQMALLVSLALIRIMPHLGAASTANIHSTIRYDFLITSHYQHQPTYTHTIYPDRPTSTDAHL